MLKISDFVYEVGAPHPELLYFDKLVPTTYGTTYNSYLIKGEKTVLIDPVDPSKKDILLQNLRELGIAKLDYLICLHAEQDHSGATFDLLKAFPEVKLVGSAKVAELMEHHLHIPRSDFLILCDDEELGLGDLTLRFKTIPFAHWPDNTMVYLAEEKMLFSSDLFGSHYAAEDPAQADLAKQKKAAQEYYAEIMMPTRRQVGKYVQWTRDLNPALILSSHGPVWRDPDVILSLYERWTSDSVAPTVIIPYVSMHDSTELMVRHLEQKIKELGLEAATVDLGDSHRDLRVSAGETLYRSVDAAAIIMATPTVLGGPHPNQAYLALLLNAMRVKTKFMGLIGSYGWGTMVEKNMLSLLDKVKAEQLPAVLCLGLPGEEDYIALDRLAEELVNKIKALPAETLLT